MIVRVTPFRRWHLDWLSEYPAAEPGYAPTLDATALAYLERNVAWTGIVDGVPIACGGLIRLWERRHTCWARLSMESSKYMLPITRHVKQLIAVPGRTEFTVRADFAAGNRWAKLLGFKIETPCLEHFGPEGEDHVGYVRYL